MKLFGYKGFTFFLIFSTVYGLSTPLMAKAPKAHNEILQKAGDTNNRISFDAILAMALETWPDKRMDILLSAEKMKPHWLHDNVLHEIDVEKQAQAQAQAQATAEAESKARGFVYILILNYGMPNCNWGQEPVQVT